MVAAPEYGRQWGGIGTYLGELIRGLIPRHELILLSAAAGSHSDAGVQTVSIATGGDMMSTYAKFQLALRRRLPDLVRSHRPDLLVVHHAQMPDLLASRPRCPVVVTVHTTILGQARGALAARRGGSPLDSSERTTLRALPALLPAELFYWSRVDHALFVSNAVRREVESAYAPSLYTAATVPNGFSLSTLEADGKPDESPDEVTGGYVLCTGRLLGLKGLSVLLRAMTRLRHAQERLEVTGSGDLTAWGRHARDVGVASGRVAFRGAVPHEANLRVLRGADVFVMPSFNESCPYALIEAMALGKPIVASAVGGILDMVKDGESALLVPAGDPDALAGAVDRLLEDPSLGRRLGRAAQQRAQSLFVANTMCTGTTRFFEDVLAHA